MHHFSLVWHCLVLSCWCCFSFFITFPPTSLSHVQFQASSWKNLILKVCRGSYPPLPRQLPYELHYLVKHIFKTNPKDRPSLNTILTSHRVSKLLRPYSPPEVKTQSSRWVSCSVTVTQTFEPEVILWLIIHQNDKLPWHGVRVRIYTPLLSQLWWLCVESDLWHVAVSSDGRGARVMPLIYCTVLYLCQVTEVEERRRPMCRWNRDEGKKVADLLGEKSLIKTSTFEGSHVNVELMMYCSR